MPQGRCEAEPQLHGGLAFRDVACEGADRGARRWRLIRKQGLVGLGSSRLLTVEPVLLGGAERGILGGQTHYFRRCSRLSFLPEVTGPEWPLHKEAKSLRTVNVCIEAAAARFALTLPVAVDPDMHALYGICQ